MYELLVLLFIEKKDLCHFLEVFPITCRPTVKVIYNNYLICLIVHVMNNKDENEIRYRIFKILSRNSNLTQRQMAREINLSLGKLNYCLTELVKKGFIKVKRFTSSRNKVVYMYILTPRGIDEKARTTVKFLLRKKKEYEQIQQQIEEIILEMEGSDLEKLVSPDNSKE